jgi:adenosylcobinamide-phosphate synthase
MLINLLTALLAYTIDKYFGEFSFIRHPVIYIGDLITFFEEKFYRDSTIRGCLLVVFVLTITASIAYIIYAYLSYLPLFMQIVISAFIASMFIAHNMLKESVLKVVSAKDKQSAIAELVSRDTDHLSESEIYKAAVETYAENLSDGVIAPLFYLLLFNLPGIVIYKTINTLDSMVGYRNKRYEKFGKCAARLDDIANFIPARITAVLIMLIAKQKDIFAFYKDGKKHESPNAGHPIAAMALALDIKLGGDTAYFGRMKKKATFGKGKSQIEADDVHKALQLL